MVTKVSTESARAIAGKVMAAEAAAILAVAERLGPDFDRAVDLIYRARSTIVTGLGKSGLIGAKVAATMASTGSPAYFVHAGDALHGDAGRLCAGDVLLCLSNSGTTAEVCAFAEIAAERSCPIIAVTGRLDSRLARMAAATLDVAVGTEADPHDLAPTTSTTVALAMGDAIAVAVMLRRGITVDDFRRNHTAGAIGDRLREAP